MRRILGIRITDWYYKVLFIAVAVIFRALVEVLLQTTNVVVLLSIVVNSILVLGSYILGARLFRGKGEPVAPTRPWWKMTARRPLSRVLGVFSVLSLSADLFLIISAASGLESSVRTMDQRTSAGAVANAAVAAILAFLYLNSAVRLGRVPEPTVESELSIPESLE
jgi:hypothetical protein